MKTQGGDREVSLVTTYSQDTGTYIATTTRQYNGLAVTPLEKLAIKVEALVENFSESAVVCKSKKATVRDNYPMRNNV